MTHAMGTAAQVPQQKAYLQLSHLRLVMYSMLLSCIADHLPCRM